MLAKRLNMPDPNFPKTAAKFMNPPRTHQVKGEWLHSSWGLRRKHSELEKVFFDEGRNHLNCFDGFHGSNQSTVRNLVPPHRISWV